MTNSCGNCKYGECRDKYLYPCRCKKEKAVSYSEEKWMDSEAFEIAIQALSEQPETEKRISETAQNVPERKTGKWIEVDDYYNRVSGRCSICGWEALLYETDVVGMDFCPNCGARLLIGEEE